jgi:hypothetical protein
MRAMGVGMLAAAFVLPVGWCSPTTTIRCDPSTDSTAVLLAALNTSHTSVTLAAGGACVSEPLALVGVRNVTLVLEQGSELQAKRGSQLFGVLLSLEAATDVTIEGRPGAIVGLATEPAPADPYAPTAEELARPGLRMWRVDYANASLYAHSEHRHALSLHHCSSVTLRRLRLAYSGGDGIYVESLTGGVFAELTVDNNFRQGMSVRLQQPLALARCARVVRFWAAALMPSYLRACATVHSGHRGARTRGV